MHSIFSAIHTIRSQYLFGFALLFSVSSWLKLRWDKVNVSRIDGAQIGAIVLNETMQNIK